MFWFPLCPSTADTDEDTVIYELDMIWSVEIDSGFSGEQSVVGTPSNLGLILEHITILNEAGYSQFICNFNIKYRPQDVATGLYFLSEDYRLRALMFFNNYQCIVSTATNRVHFQI